MGLLAGSVVAVVVVAVVVIVMARASSAATRRSSLPTVRLPARPLMLVSAAGQSRRDVDFSKYIRLVDVRRPMYPTATGASSVRLTREPDPLTCVPAMGWLLHGARVVLCVSRCTFHPAYVVFATRGGKFARAAGGVVQYTATVDEEDDAYWWLVASDASGGIFNASRPLFPGTAPYAPRALAPVVVQPASAVLAHYGTRLALRGCATVYAPPTECDLAKQGAAPCTACNHLPPALCEHVAQLGACGTAFGPLCAVTCAVRGGLHRSDAPTLRLMPTNARTVRPKVAPSSPMFVTVAAKEPAALEPQMSDLARALATRRWSHDPGSDPAVGVANAKVARWSPHAQRYFWSVLTAMTERRLDGPGTCWFADAHGGFTRGGAAVAMEATTGLRTGVVAPALTCGAMCAEDRYLSYYGMLGLCDDAEWRRRWASCAEDMARRTGFTRMRNTASCGTDDLVAAVSEKAVERALRMAPTPVAKARLRALLTQDYAALSWSGVQAMFRLTPEEVAVLKAAVAPLDGRVATGARSRWRDLPAALRLQLIERWNEGARLAFAETEFGPASLVLLLPKHTGGGHSDPMRVASHFPFQHAFWPSDRVSALGRNVATRDADGAFGAAVPRTCLRCPSSAARSAVETERVACGFHPAPHEGAARCLARAHSQWRDHPSVADGSYYEDGESVAFIHGVRLADGMTNLPDGTTRERVRLCDPKHGGGWSNIDGASFPWTAHAPYSSDPPPPMTWNPFRTTAPTGNRPVRIFNDLLRSVEIPPGFAVYVTPHYHGFHASVRTCHHGVPHVRGTPGARSVLDPSVEPFFTHVLQCRSSSWAPHLKEHPRDKPEPQASETPGVILVNDDLGSAWRVEPGDNLNDAGELKVFAGGKAQFKADLYFPSHVNCVAAWNFYAYPRHWLQRSNEGPYDGDALPAFDAVASDAHNNVRATSDSLAAFFEHSRSLNVRVVLRTGSVPAQ